MTTQETTVLRDLGETINAASPEEQRTIAAMLAAFRAGIDIGKTRAAAS